MSTDTAQRGGISGRTSDGVTRPARGRCTHVRDDDAGPAVVPLAGAPTTRRVFPVDALAAGHRAAGVDPRSHGLSEAPGVGAPTGDRRAEAAGCGTADALAPDDRAHAADPDRPDAAVPAVGGER